MQRIPKTAISMVIAFYMVTIAGCAMLDDHGRDRGHDSTAAPGSDAAAALNNKTDTSRDTVRYQTKTGKTIIVSETHPKGRSLSTIAINTRGFEHNFKEVYENQDPISGTFLADLDGNGFDELYIITTAAGSGSYGSVIGLASNKDKSLSMIYFPPVEKDDEHFIGYMGHDTFKIENHRLVRLFPIYKEGDTNQEPTGGTRKLTYGLFPGEANWQLKVTTSETLNIPQHD